MSATGGNLRVDQRLRSIRARNFRRLRPLDTDLLALVGDDVNNAFLTNPAIHTVYQYLVDYVCDFAWQWFKPGGRKLDVLDWGSGKGHISYLLQKRGVNVVSADRSNRSADSSFGQSTPIIDKTGLVVVPLEHDYRLPFDDASFDVVISMGVLEHVPNDLESLNEIRRILRPRGLFFCFFLPYTLSWTQRLLHMTGSRYHDRLYSVRTVRHLLEASDLQPLDLWHRQIFPKNSVRYRGYRRIERLDQWITERTPLRLLATNIEFVAMKPASAGVDR